MIGRVCLSSTQSSRLASIVTFEVIIHSGHPSLKLFKIATRSVTTLSLKSFRSGTDQPHTPWLECVFMSERVCFQYPMSRMSGTHQYAGSKSPRHVGHLHCPANFMPLLDAYWDSSTRHSALSNANDIAVDPDELANFIVKVNATRGVKGVKVQHSKANLFWPLFATA